MVEIISRFFIKYILKTSNIQLSLRYCLKVKLYTINNYEICFWTWNIYSNHDIYFSTQIYFNNGYLLMQSVIIAISKWNEWWSFKSMKRIYTHSFTSFSPFFSCSRKLYFFPGRRQWNTMWQMHITIVSGMHVLLMLGIH